MVTGCYSKSSHPSNFGLSLTVDGSDILIAIAQKPYVSCFGCGYLGENIFDCARRSEKSGLA